jgi:CubicO group peptidase (beta-lactamase class C family)
MNSKHLAGLSLLAFYITSCSHAAKVDLHPPCATPAHLEDGWETVVADKAGFNESALCSALSSAINGDHNIHAVLIERHGRIATEIYRRAPDHPINVLYGLWNPFSFGTDFNPETLHDVRSISKSVISLAFGIAQKQGKIKSLSDPVLQFYPELSDLTQPNLHSVTLENLLTMSSGLQWDEGALPNDETKLYWKENQARFVLDRPIAESPGQAFHYNSGGNAVLADILSRSTGEPWLEFIKKNLFGPLEIKSWEWVNDFRGRPLAFTGLRLLPRDMLKVGRLALEHGRWKGRQIVPSEWITTSIQPHLSTGIKIETHPPEDLEYGYQWWTGTVHWKEKTLRWSAAFGNGGQRIFVIPELDATIVILAGEYNSHDINRIVNQLFENIVAALRE